MSLFSLNTSGVPFFATVLWTKQTVVAGAKVIAWLANFAEMNQDDSPGSQNSNKSYAIAVDQVLTAYWS